MNWMRTTPGGFILRIRVIPRAARNEIQGVLGDALKIRLQAPPVKGRANQALLTFLSDTLGVPPGALLLARGTTSRDKEVLVRGLDAATLRARLET
jgi:uncharacterized protein (TIGR00251 family)